MEKIKITVRILPDGKEVVVGVPLHTLGMELITAIVKRYDLSLDKLQKYVLTHKESGQTFGENQTIKESKINEGDTLLMTPIELNNELVKFKDKIANVPSEILIKGPAYIEEYLERIEGTGRLDKPQPLSECKLIFIGSGTVGKTSLIKRLVNNTYDENELKTEGIEITKWSLLRNKKSVKLNIWDFGGQEIMHATHKFFMTKRSIYVLVINPRIQDQYTGDIELNYWLKLISSFGGSSPIIVVMNKCESHKIDLAKGSINDSFPQIIGFAETSCKKNTGINKLKDLIGQGISKLKHLDDIIPLSYLKVKQELELSNKDYLHYHQYIELCRKIDSKFSKNDLELLISLLNDLGVMLNISENRRLIDTQVLNPQWITNGVYSIINSKKIIENKGVISEEEISNILDTNLYPSIKERGYIMDMMNHFELCYQLPDKRDLYFVPGAFPKDKPSKFKWTEKKYIYFQLKYDVFPNSIMSRFLVKQHSNIYKFNYWRQGAILSEGKSTALVEAFPLEKKINIKVSGESDKRYMLTNIRREFELIHGSISELEVDSYIVLNEDENILVKYEDLVSYEEAGEKKYFEPRKKIKYDVKELLNGIENRIDLNVSKKKLSKGKLKEAIEDLISIFPNSNKVIMLSARYNKIKDEKISGLIDIEIFLKEENNIISSAREMIDEFQKEHGSQQSIPVNRR